MFSFQALHTNIILVYIRWGHLSGLWHLSCFQTCIEVPTFFWNHPERLYVRVSCSQTFSRCFPVSPQLEYQENVQESPRENTEGKCPEYPQRAGGGDVCNKLRTWNWKNKKNTNMSGWKRCAIHVEDTGEVANLERLGKKFESFSHWCQCAIIKICDFHSGNHAPWPSFWMFYFHPSTERSRDFHVVVNVSTVQMEWKCKKKEKKKHERFAYFLKNNFVSNTTTAKLTSPLS